ncbi:MAG TPA: phosphotransferase [Alphaproteobacteria bacterium]|nr:phosphotransferase [Alphaproteobacteria bacterium]
MAQALNHLRHPELSLEAAAARVANLPCWSGPVTPEPLGGGITNRNFLVVDRGEKLVARVGGDIPVHGVMRFNDIAAARAAHQAGISPEVIHAAPDMMVLRFVEGRTLTADEVRDNAMLARILEVVRRCHRDVPRYLRGPVLAFSVFHVIRDYAATLNEGGCRRAGDLARWSDLADRLSRAVGPIDLVFGHNDLLGANFIDDGERLWLIDWDYAGFNSPLFDLGGVAGNHGLSPAQEEWLLEAYFGRPPDAALRRSYAAMKCATLLREAMWSLVSEIYSDIAHDFVAYTETCLARFDAAWPEFVREWGEP